MKFLKTTLLSVLLFIFCQPQYGQSLQDSGNGGIMIAQTVILQGDTLPYFALPVFYCYPELKFKNKKQKEFALLSQNLKEPKTITIVTYQALHSALKE